MAGLLLAAIVDTNFQLSATNGSSSNFINSFYHDCANKILVVIVIAIALLMIKLIASLFKKSPPLDSFDQTLTRERLILSARIIAIDDEEPLLISELTREGFSVHHDREGQDLHNIENQIYDLAIIDYHGVGRRLGNSQGLDLLKHIRRVSPRTRLVAYTSRSLTSAESEFFRLSHVVLPKDMGLGDSLNLIENELRKAFSKEYLFEALIAKLAIKEPAEKQKIQNSLIKALSKNNEKAFTEEIKKLGGTVAEKAVEIIISHLFLTK